MIIRPLVFSLLSLSANAFVTPLHNQKGPVLLFAEETDYVEEPDSSSSEAETYDDVGPSDVESIEDFSENAEKDVETPLASIDETIFKLIQLGASTGRGEFADKQQKETAASLISALEMQNPTPETAKSPLMNGTWDLLYSSTQLFRSSPFFMAGRAVCSSADQAKQYDWFCDMHRQALAISTIGQVRQVVSSTRLVSEFEVNVGAVPFISDFTPFKYSGGLPASIQGAIVSSADITPTESGDGWELFMDKVEIKGSNIPGLRQVLDQGLNLESRQLGSFLENNVESYENPKPIFRTTYLSDTLRISRDQDGKVFVYGKVTDDTQPSDYKNVEADLGLLKLLGGFNDAVTKFYL